MLKCDTDENCSTPPVNFVGLAGTDSYNVKTVIANEFWVGYTKNFPFFGASPFVKQEVKNGEVKDFLRSNGLYEGNCTECLDVSNLHLPNCGPSDFECAIAIDEIFMCPCEETPLTGYQYPTCTKPLTQFYTPDMLVAGKQVYPNLYDLGGSVWPAYESCPVYSPAGDLETRDVPQWQPEQLVSPRIIKQFSRPEQVHYCDKANGQYIFCENDPLGLADRTSLCEDKLGKYGVKGRTIAHRR